MSCGVGRRPSCTCTWTGRCGPPRCWTWRARRASASPPTRRRRSRRRCSSATRRVSRSTSRSTRSPCPCSRRRPRWNASPTSSSWTSRPSTCGIRTRPPAESLELARAATDYRGAGVIAFDLAGAERGHPARDHRTAFEYAAAHGLACTCHAGEGDGPDSIRQALHDCGAVRVGHGTRLGEDPSLLDEVVERRIPLEMCLSSNVHTHAVATVAEHPFKGYLQRGVVVTLNTDGRLTDGITLTDEYYLAHAALGLSPDELARVVLNACESAFLPEYEKVALVSRVQSELEALQ